MVTITERFKKLVRKVDVLLLFVLKFLYNICMCMIHFDMPFFLIMVISVWVFCWGTSFPCVIYYSDRLYHSYFVYYFCWCNAAVEQLRA